MSREFFCFSLHAPLGVLYRLPYYTLSPTYSVCKNHGYLAGEQAVCPHCGERTEVNSRITGYYRPVQNWNDGKAQEFRDRVTYDIGSSRLTHTGPLHMEGAGCSDGVCSVETAEKSYLLFATRTCPNCRILYPALDKTGIAFEKIYADEYREATERYDISQVPTLVIQDGQSVEKVVGVSAIIQRLDL